MQVLINLDRSGRQSLQGQIFEQVRALVLRGHLRPGTPLPATRRLAQDLGVSRNTVLLAYERLFSEGYLQARPAAGTFVSACLPENGLTVVGPASAPRDQAERLAAHRRPVFRGRAQAVVRRDKIAIDFWIGRADAHLFPLRAWRRLLVRHLSRAGSNLTEYRDPAGHYALRQAIADRLGPARGVIAKPEQIIIVGGSQEGLNIVARLFVATGTAVAIEDPCYQGAALVFESYGARLVPVRVDDQGIDVDRLPKAPTGLLYVTPSHQYPMGGTLSLERRIRLLDWAWRTGAYVVEDDYDGDFRYQGSPLTALKGLDEHGAVIHLGTFSKSLGAGLRIGFMVVPDELAEPVSTVVALLNNGHPWLDQAALAEFIGSGSYERHLRRVRRSYMSRRDCLIEELRKHFGDPELSGTEGGMHIVWHLPPELPRAAEVQALARQAGVGVYTIDEGAAYDVAKACGFDANMHSDSTLLLGYSSLSEKDIRLGIERLAAAVDWRRLAWRTRAPRNAARLSVAVPDARGEGHGT